MSKKYTVKDYEEAYDRMMLNIKRLKRALDTVMLQNSILATELEKNES